jgi:hypothetical protein
MKNVWPWIMGIAFGLIVIAQVGMQRSSRQAYWIARGTVPRAVQVTQVEDLTLIRFPCGSRAGNSVWTERACGFYVWKK